MSIVNALLEAQPVHAKRGAAYTAAVPAPFLSLAIRDHKRAYPFLDRSNRWFDPRDVIIRWLENNLLEVATFSDRYRVPKGHSRLARGRGLTHALNNPKEPLGGPFAISL
jgi:hypothetical protein